MEKEKRDYCVLSSYEDKYCIIGYMRLWRWLLEIAPGITITREDGCGQTEFLAPKETIEYLMEFNELLEEGYLFRGTLEDYWKMVEEDMK